MMRLTFGSCIATSLAQLVPMRDWEPRGYIYTYIHIYIYVYIYNVYYIFAAHTYIVDRLMDRQIDK